MTRPSDGRAAAALNAGGGPAKDGTPNTATTATGRKTYLVPLKEAAPGTRIPDPHREESRLEAYLRQQQIQLPEENVLKFVDVCIMELDPDEHAAFFNREWTHTEVLDAHDRVLRRWEKAPELGSRGRQSAPSSATGDQRRLTSAATGSPVLEAKPSATATALSLTPTLIRLPELFTGEGRRPSSRLHPSW
jgi:hypothetical protein